MANRFFRIFSLTGLLVFTISPYINSQDQQSPASDLSKEQLQAIEKEIKTLRDQANKLAEQENSIMTQLDQYELQYQMKSQEIQLLDLRQSKTTRDIIELQLQLQDLEKNLDQQREHLSMRLVDAYKLGRLNYLKLMLQTNSASDLLRAYQYVTFLARDDSRRLTEYRNSQKEKETMKIRLEQEGKNLTQLKTDLEQAHNDLVRSRMEKVQLLQSVQTERTTHLNALSELKVAANQLQGLFVQQPEPVATPQSGVEMGRFKGALDWPLRGRIVREFGMQKHPKFGTMTMSNGIEIEAAEGAPVMAVYEGVVMFSEWFKGYGKSIILSHTGGIYTLYAHNSDLLVQRGDQVQRGQMIARAGSTGSLTGPNVYFELREKDRPVNPRVWLRKMGVR
ncbi:MAG TPA: peptidoglycan DD-metalloendopeptidase family protein [Acidobacteriota bacterium]|nr:peptidoglycan DD-metalloendopeptidase family protein [Acidobacteriota bacterium]